MIRVGIDIGGTGIQVGVVNQQYHIVAEESIVTNTSIPFEEQIVNIADCVKSTVSNSGFSLDQIDSVGIGIPGMASKKTGEIINCTNMGWHHVPFREEFIRHISKPVYIENDANVAALAESVAGISAGTSSSVFITIGTGIGSGIIINNRIWNGAHGIGGELGHVIFDLNGIPCTCGNHGCLERYCSATALIRMGREAASSNPNSGLMKSVNNDLSRIEAKTVIDCAKNGDPLAKSIFRTFIRYLSQAIASVVNLIDPEVIVLGGGVSKAGDFLIKPILEEYPQYVVFRDQEIPPVKLAVLGSKAGIIGAAMLN
jgi:glucokinase